MKVRLTQVFQVLGVIVVQFDDLFDEGVLVWEIGKIQKTALVELLVDERVAPIDRQTARDHRLKDFFGGVTGKRPVFKGNIEFILLEEINLATRTAGDRPADVVEQLSAGIHCFIFGKTMEEINTVAVFAPVVSADYEAAEFFLRGQDFSRVILFLDDFLRVAIDDIVRQLQMPRIIHLCRRDGVIALVKIWYIRFA